MFFVFLICRYTEVVSPLIKFTTKQLVCLRWFIHWWIISSYKCIRILVQAWLINACSVYFPCFALVWSGSNLRCLVRCDESFSVSIVHFIWWSLWILWFWSMEVNVIFVVIRHIWLAVDTFIQFSQLGHFHRLIVVVRFTVLDDLWRCNHCQHNYFAGVLGRWPLTFVVAAWWPLHTKHVCN